MLNNYRLYIFKKYTLCHSVFCHIINAFPCILKDVDIIFLVFNQLELTNSVKFRMLENNIIFSISENVMHHFRKSNILFISLKICVFQCPNSICSHSKISCACHIPFISNLFPNTEQRLLFKMVPNMNGFVISY